jgi:hypothetical protein
MFKSLFKKSPIIVIALVAVFALATGAFAYWTTTGAGTGTSTNAASNGTLVLHAITAGGMTPGKVQAVTYTADNTAGTSSLFVGTITTVVTIDAGHVGCLPADFTVPAIVSNTRVLAGATGAALLGTQNITFADTGVNQDACKGAIVTLTGTSN